MKVSRPALIQIAFLLLLLTPVICSAQPPTAKKRLRAPANVRGFVGGEATDRYVMRARKGQTITISITWKKEEEQDTSASFSVTRKSDPAALLTGQDSDGGKSWTGKVPKTGDYLIEVVAHPYAHYQLRVRLK